ncbi:MAG: ATP-dependent DNA ligase [Patescibacteria group bacterium]
MQFSHFAQHLEQLESLSSRLDMTAVLAKFFLDLDQAEIVPACYLLQGRLVPQYLSLEFQLSEKMIIRALTRLVSTQADQDQVQTNLFGEEDDSSSRDKITKLYKQVGDLGQTAVKVFENYGLSHRATHSKPLSLHDVFGSLTQIAQASGSGSQEKKVIGLVELLKQLDATSAKFIVRIILGKMRLGFSTMTMLDALSWAVCGSKLETPLLEEAYQKRADVGQLTESYLKLTSLSVAQRRSNLKSYSVQVGVPVVPALCQRLNTATEIIDKMGQVIAEPKYDGMRVQIHILKSTENKQKPVMVFTRSLENISPMFPELFTLVEKLDCKSCILDGEAIGFDPATGHFKSFQETITRKRKHQIEVTAKAVPLQFFVFDIMELDGQPLIDRSLEERKQILSNLLKSDESGILTEVKFETFDDAKKLKNYHQQMLTDGLEGVVIKQPKSQYAGGRKGWRWVKIKEAEGTTGKLTDTLDLVMMGYYKGRGKRAQFGLGAILTGIINDQGQIETIAKIGTGMSEEQLTQLKKLADIHQASTQPKQYQLVHKTLTPDAWLEPVVVLEIAADEITQSSVHEAGVALRFPRLIKIRPDKTWPQATSQSELAGLSQTKQ